jgi:hypothetical protein
MRINRGQEFMIGGYRPTAKNFDGNAFVYHESSDLIYVAAGAMDSRVKAGRCCSTNPKSSRLITAHS